jgi:asparagine synthase (glutamine-hydrolysing)
MLPVGWGKNLLHNLSLPRIERYLDSMSLFPRRALSELADPRADWPQTSLSRLVDHSLDPLSQLQDLDLKSYLPGDILTKVDRMSMASSLEARVPLLDHPLVEFACALPARTRLRSGTTKYLLKRALRGRVPPEVLTRRKQGFAVPLETWLSSRLPAFFQESLGVHRLAAVGIRPSAVRSLLEQFALTRRRDYCDRLWSLTVLDHALRRLRVGAGA